MPSTSVPPIDRSLSSGAQAGAQSSMQASIQVAETSGDRQFVSTDWTLVSASAWLKPLVSVDREPEVTRYVSGPWSDPAAHRAFVEQRTRRLYSDGLGYWTLASKD